MKVLRVLRKGKMVVSATSFHEKILHYVHSSPEAGHRGYHKTLSRAKLDFYWPGMRKDVKMVIRVSDMSSQ